MDDATLRNKLLDPDLVFGIETELFMHGHEDVDDIPALAIGVVIGHLLDECHICAAGDVRKSVAEYLVGLQEATDDRA